MSFLPSGVVTLTTDLGLGDPSVGIMKGVMLSRFAQLKIIDLCHQVPPQDVFWGAYALAGSYKHFPPGSVHCGVVAPGPGIKRGVLVAERGGHVFVAPNNGLLTRILAEGGQEPHVVDLDRVPVAPIRRSFHTRDIVAPIAALLASGKLTIEDCGDAESAPKTIENWPVDVVEDGAAGVVVGEDRFGNVFTSLTEENVPQDTAGLVVEIDGRAFDLKSTYVEVDSGQPLALFNAFGMLEIAIRDGKAAEQFRWERGTPISVRRR